MQRNHQKRGLLLLTAGVLGQGLAIGLSAKDAWTAPESAASVKNPLADNAAAVTAGKKIYEDRCADCHGSKGKGDGPAATDLDPKPGDLSKASMNDQPDGALFWKISEGKKPMPTYKSKLSEEQRWQVINYVRTLAPKNNK